MYNNHIDTQNNWRDELIKLIASYIENNYSDTEIIDAMTKRGKYSQEDIFLIIQAAKLLALSLKEV